MRFSYLTLAASPGPESDWQAIQDQLELARLAEQLGFDGVWLTEHYFTGESVYNDALTFAAAVAMQTSKLRIGFAVVQLPFHHPVRLATQLALLDNLSNGRIDVGVGKGTVFNEYEFVGHGLRSDDSRARAAEAQTILERCFAGEPFSFKGDYYDLSVPALRPKPVQISGPPIWRSVISPPSFSDAGRQGLPILTARLPVSRIRERWDLYREGMDAGGIGAEKQSALLQQSGIWRNLYVAESDAQAEDELADALRNARRHMIHIRQELNPDDFVVDPAVLSPWVDPSADEESAITDAVQSGSICGGPKRVKGQIEELRDAGVGHVVLQTTFGDMAHAQTVSAMERFGTGVLPAFAAA